MKKNLVSTTLTRLAALLLATTFVHTAMAATFNWTGAGDGTSWNDPDNWGGTAYPGENQAADVAQSLEDATATVVIDSAIPYEVNDIKANTDVDLNITTDADISVKDVIRNGGSIVMDGGRLEKTGALGSINGEGTLDFTMIGGTLVGTDDLFINSASTVVGGTGKVEIADRFRASDDFTVESGGQVYDTKNILAIIQDGSTYTVAGGSFTLDNGGSEFRFRPGGGTFAVEGSSSTVTLNEITDSSSTAADNKFAFTPDADGTSLIEVLTTPTEFDLMTLFLNDNTSVAWSGSELPLFDLPGATPLDPTDQFSNALEGATFSFTDSTQTHNLEITYQGGDGNAILLTRIIPEPTSLALLGLGAAALLRRRRRA